MPEAQKQVRSNWGNGIHDRSKTVVIDFVVYMALTRVVAEGGVAVIYAPLVAPDAAISAIGTSFFGAPGLVALAFTRIFANDLLNFAMPHIANSLKLSGQIGAQKRPRFWGMLLALVAGMGGALWMLMHLAYSYGAINLRPQHFIWLPNYVFDYAAARNGTPAEASWSGWFHTGFGGAIMGLLLLARRYWFWWPLHPILRYGGVRAYRQVRPFFLGLILGHFTIFGVFWLIDALTGMIGNSLFF